MAKLIKVADSLLNVRGSFKIGPLDVGTQAALVRRKNGKWLMLDSSTPSQRSLSQLMVLTRLFAKPKT
jgi:hypothetical protein